MPFPNAVIPIDLTVGQGGAVQTPMGYDPAAVAFPPNQRIGGAAFTPGVLPAGGALATATKSAPQAFTAAPTGMVFETEVTDLRNELVAGASPIAFSPKFDGGVSVKIDLPSITAYTGTITVQPAINAVPVPGSAQTKSFVAAVAAAFELPNIPAGDGDLVTILCSSSAALTVAGVAGNKISFNQ